MNYIDKIIEINNYLEINLTSKRYNHSLLVAKMSKEIAIKLNYNINQAYLAGLCHDIAREKPKDYLLANVNKSKYSKEFYNNSILFHGSVGVKILFNNFNIIDNDILEAVEYHSIGSVEMCNLAKIVYVADYISFDREHISSNLREEILNLDLNNMVIKVIELTKTFLNLKNIKLLPETIMLYEKLIRINNEK